MQYTSKMHEKSMTPDTLMIAEARLKHKELAVNNRGAIESRRGSMLGCNQPSAARGTRIEDQQYLACSSTPQFQVITKQSRLSIGRRVVKKSNIHRLLAGATANLIGLSQPTMSRRQLSNLHIAFSLCLCFAFVGCERPITEIEIISFEEEQLGAEQYVESFPNGSFARDAYENVNITFEIPPTLVTIERPATAAELAALTNADSEQPNANDAISTDGDVIVRANSAALIDDEDNADAMESSAEADDDLPTMIEEQVYIAQMLHIEMLWQPKPGKTFAERTQTDAGITYCLQRGSDRARYEGAGFVYFTLDDDGRTITGQIESATLYPAGATDDSVAVLGSCRIRGPFVASLSANGVMSVKRRIRSEFEDLDGLR